MDLRKVRKIAERIVAEDAGEVKGLEERYRNRYTKKRIGEILSTSSIQHSWLAKGVDRLYRALAESEEKEVKEVPKGFDLRTDFREYYEEYFSTRDSYRDIAPHITRQRLIMECIIEGTLQPNEMIDYLDELGKVTDMKIINGPGVHTAHEKGYMAWVHWSTSGAQMYSYDPEGWGTWSWANSLVTVDCYTCKPFSVKDAVGFTSRFLQVKDIVWKEA